MTTDIERALTFKRNYVFIDSLNKALEDAGGTLFSPERIQNMTILELFATLSANDIIFIYAGEHNND